MCVSEKEIGYLAYINFVLLDFFAWTFFWEKGGGGCLNVIPDSQSLVFDFQITNFGFSLSALEVGLRTR